jgi:DNA-binding beta-propeller fold protein YncE
MKFLKIIQLFFILQVILIFASCAEKFDLTDIDTGDGNINFGGDTVYVQLKPVWEGYNRPQDIMVGREPFIYVADTDNDRIVMLNLNGDVLGARAIKQPVALAQDYRLNLIVCAQFDTIVGGQSQTFNAVYKIDLVASSHQIGSAPIKKLLPRPADLNRPLVEYTGACAFYNNTFYISRKGPNNTSFVDPDNSILIFSPKKLLGIPSDEDTLIGRVPNIDPLGQGLVSAYNISSLTSFNDQTIDMIVTLTGENSFKAQWLEYVITPIDQRYLSNFSPNSVSFMIPNKFSRPEGSAVDQSRNIFIADADRDSIYKFNSFGDELQSFGTFSDDSFNEPHGVAFFDKTLYVADTGNNRIVRFILSTEQ